MTKVTITKDAEQDIKDIYFYISVDNSFPVAQKQIDKIESSVKLLEKTPNIGVQYGKRRYIVSGKYLIFYKFTNENHIEITRVFDGRYNWQKDLL